MTLLKSFFITILMFFVIAAHANARLQTLDGEIVDLSSLKGKWVFINYWASWCGPCLEEISELNRFYKDNKDKNVVVFAVNYDSMPIRQQRYLMTKFNIHYPSLKRSSVAALHFGPVNVVPVTYVLNPQGKLSTTLYGGQTIESLKGAMA